MTLSLRLRTDERTCPSSQAVAVAVEKKCGMITSASTLNPRRHDMPTLLETINAQIEMIISGVTRPVLEVSSALALQLSEMASAYAGNCPDQTTDVKMLDLDRNYITLLDSLRRTRPRVYEYIANTAQKWHDKTPPLLEQPAIMVSVSAQIVGHLDAVKASAHNLCPPPVASALSASLSTANAHPPDPVLAPEEEEPPPDNLQD